MNKKKNQDLYIVESPLQILCANEARYTFANDDTCSVMVVKLTRSEINNRQMKALLSKLNFDRVIILPSLYALTFTDFVLITMVFFWRIKKKAFRNIFIGEVQNKLLFSLGNNIRHNRLLFLDDGIATIAVQKHLANHHGIAGRVRENRLIANMRNIYAGTLGIKLTTRGIPDFFTCFNLPPIGDQKIIKNQFSSLKEEWALDFEKYGQTVFFIGGPISEDGKLREDDEIRMIEVVAAHYKLSGIALYYCSHRRESEDKLERIVSLDNVCGIRKGEFPLEVDFIFRGEGISHIAAFISTALFTLSSIFELQSANMFSVPDHKWKSEYLPVYHATRKNYADEDNINLVKLEELENIE